MITKGKSMTNPASAIRAAIDQAMDAEPQMTRLMVALANRHGGGGLERGAKANAQSRHEDGEVRSEPDLIKALSAPLRKLLKTIGVDPARSNAVVMALRADGVVRVNLLVVKPGDVDKGQFVSFEGWTEKEWFDIVNGPEPKRYPYLKMPQPVGSIIEIFSDGSLRTPIDHVPAPLEWVDVPIAWDSIPGLTPDLAMPPQTSRNPTADEYGRQMEIAQAMDPFAKDVCAAIAMEPPGLRDIRRMGVDNGFRDEQGNVVA